MPPRARLDIFMRNGQGLVVNFPDDEAANACVERLKKALSDPNGCYNIDMEDHSQIPPITIYHYIPSREIVRFTVITYPRSETSCHSAG